VLFAQLLGSLRAGEQDSSFRQRFARSWFTGELIT
jgi:hypothetical protein